MSEDSLAKQAFIKNALFTAQEFFIHHSSPPHEILPLDFNYQDIRIVTTKVVEVDGLKVLFQTSGCDCGPQPQIKGGIVRGRIDWENSCLKQALSQCKITKISRSLCKKLAGQDIIKELYLVENPGSQREKELFESAIEREFKGKKVEPF